MEQEQEKQPAPQPQEPQAAANQPEAPAQSEAPAQAQPQTNTGKKHDFRYLKIALITIAFYIVVLFVLSFILVATKLDNNDVALTIGNIIAFASIFLGIFIGVKIVNKEEKDKAAANPQPAEGNGTSAPVAPAPIEYKDVAKKTASTIGIFFLYDVFFFFLLAGGTLWMTMESCKDIKYECAGGWLWGFILLPGSFVASQILAAIATFITKKIRSKKN